MFTHAAAVSAAMGAMAEYFGEDKAWWEAIGYLHDVDYEKFPTEHCQHVRELLAGEDIDEYDISAIISHGWGLVSNEIEPSDNLMKSLFTVDELTGIVQAYALMREDKLAGMELPFQGPDVPYEQSDSAEKKSRGDGRTGASALLKALKPYMNDQRADSVERLLKLLPTADLIRTALHAFGELS